MNEPSSASRTPFIIILILLLAITGVQYLLTLTGWALMPPWTTPKSPAT